LLTAMAYVDLNPIRAGIAKTPEDSEFTSIYDRIRTLSNVRSEQEPHAFIPLRAFSDEVEENASAIPYSFRDYLSREAYDWTPTESHPEVDGCPIDASTCTP